MEPTQRGHFAKDPSGQWQVTSPRKDKDTIEKVKRMSSEELTKDLNSATPYRPGDNK